MENENHSKNIKFYAIEFLARNIPYKTYVYVWNIYINPEFSSSILNATIKP